MPRFRDPLKHVHVALPCKADWDQMIGSDRIRFCGQCSLNVYNLSAMTRDEAESLIARTEGRLCVRFYRRRDGSIITQDCPVGLRAVRERVSYWTRAIAAAALSFLAAFGLEFVAASFPLRSQVTMGKIVVPSQRELVTQGELVGTGPRRPQPTMGKLAVQRTPHH